MKIFELRTYTLHVGKLSSAIKIYEDLGWPALKKYKDNIISLYFIKNSVCYNRNNRIVKEIYATYKTNDCSMEYFQNGFQIVLEILYNDCPDCIIESIGHTIQLLDWLKNTGYILNSKKYIVGFYLFNYIHNTIKPNDLFINL